MAHNIEYLLSLLPFILQAPTSSGSKKLIVGIPLDQDCKKVLGNPSRLEVFINRLAPSKNLLILLTKQNFKIFSLTFMLKLDELFRNHELFIISLFSIG